MVSAWTPSRGWGTGPCPTKQSPSSQACNPPLRHYPEPCSRIPCLNRTGDSSDQDVSEESKHSWGWEQAGRAHGLFCPHWFGHGANAGSPTGHSHPPRVAIQGCWGALGCPAPWDTSPGPRQTAGEGTAAAGSGTERAPEWLRLSTELSVCVASLLPWLTDSGHCGQPPQGARASTEPKNKHPGRLYLNYWIPHVFMGLWGISASPSNRKCLLRGHLAQLSPCRLGASSKHTLLLNIPALSMSMLHTQGNLFQSNAFQTVTQSENCKFLKSYINTTSMSMLQTQGNLT